MPIRLGRTPTKMVDCRQVRGCRSISFHSSYNNGFGVRIASGFVMDYAGLGVHPSRCSKYPMKQTL